MFAFSSEDSGSGVGRNPNRRNNPDHEGQDSSVRFLFPEKDLTHKFTSGMRLESRFDRPQQGFEDFRNFRHEHVRKDPTRSPLESPSWRLTRSSTFFRDALEPGVKSVHLDGNRTGQNPPPAMLISPRPTMTNQTRDQMTATSPMYVGGLRYTVPTEDDSTPATLLPFFKCCVFCKNNGEDERFFTSHNLKVISDK